MQPKLRTGHSIDLSVIMVTWNSLRITADSLLSIEKHTNGIAYEVFLIDNGTTKDDTVNVIPQQFPSVRFICNDTNQGFTRANNQGIRKSKGRYVLLLNNDTLQLENALGESVRYMDEHPDVGALGIKHLNNDAARSYQPSHFAFPKPSQDIFGLFRRKKALSTPTEPEKMEQDVDWVCGSYLLMRRECLDQIGMLDERYFIYDEDIDWCLQANRAGWKIRYWKGASMIHLGAASNPLMRDKTLVMFRSHVSYLLKNHGRLWAFLFYLGMLVLLISATIKQGIGVVLLRSTWSDVKVRLFRLNAFMWLRSGRSGG